MILYLEPINSYYLSVLHISFQKVGAMYFILNLGVEGLKYSSIEILKLFHVSPTEC